MNMQQHLHPVTLAICLIAGGCGGAPIPSAELTRDQKLVQSCYRIDIDEVLRSLCKGANINGVWGNAPPLTIDDDEKGLAHVSQAKWTPLMALAQSPVSDRGDDARVILYMLLSRNPDVNATDGYGATALQMAVSTDKTQLARSLLGHGANPNTKSRAYIDGPSNVTPLHEACNSQELFGMLIDHGADFTAKDSDGHTPLDWVELSGKFQVEVRPGHVTTYSASSGDNWDDVHGRAMFHATR